MRATARKRSTAPREVDTSTGSAAPATLSPGSITTAMIAEAAAYTLRQDLDLAKRHLRVDEERARPADRLLIARVMATLDGDGTTLRRALEYPPVNELFARGVMYF